MRHRDSARLPDAAEALFKDWPVREPSEAAWELATEQLLSELRRSPSREDDAALLEPPLPRMADEGSLASSPRVVGRAGETRERESAAEVAELERTRDERPSRRGLEPRRRWARAVAAPLALIGAAAALWLYSSQREPSIEAAPPVAVHAEAASVRPDAPGPHKEARPPEPEGVQEEDYARVDDLPLEVPEAPSRPGPVKPVAKRVARAEIPATEPSAEEADPQDEFETRLTPADETAAATRLEPSHGETMSAIAAHLGTAQLCLAGHEHKSDATIVFGSDGAVQRVEVVGPAAGTRAADCIEQAFSRVRVRPFAKPSFTVRYPVRP